jgi:hypothetical protein
MLLALATNRNVYAAGGRPDAVTDSITAYLVARKAARLFGGMRFDCPSANLLTRRRPGDGAAKSQRGVGDSQGVVICGTCDAWEQASHNGDLVHAVDAGLLTRDDVAQLGDVLIGTADGRESESDITIFDSTGLAIQDLAIALAAMEHADELDLPQLDL